jgi:protein gp37
MGEDSKIQWCHHTFNPWHGCVKVSEACKFCYAEVATPVRVKRAHGLELWGADAARDLTSAANWRDPHKWNRDAKAAGVRARVFCASLADVFEDRRDLDGHRERLWDLIEATPHLDWLLLTKRPECIKRLIRPAWVDAPRANVWLGTTVENHARAEERIIHLSSVPAVVHFLSIEPMLEAVDLLPFLDPVAIAAAIMHHHQTGHDCGGGGDGAHCDVCDVEWTNGRSLVDWVIVGGESGPGARPCDVNWLREIVRQCREASVPVFVKQLGAKPYDSLESDRGSDEPHPDGAGADPSCRLQLRNRKGGDIDEFPDDLRVREFPTVRT